MCTAATYKAQNHYFGRTLDYEISFGEQVVITPRNYTLTFRKMPKLKSHYSFIGMAAVIDGTPLYYDATNEKGLSIAGLLFDGNAMYFSFNQNKKNNLAPFELIPYLLAKCETVEEAKQLLNNANIIDLDFSKDLPNTPLHWMIADKKCSIVVESVEDGLKIYDNPVGVLTNNPPFPIQLFNLRQYLNLTPYEADNRFSKNIPLEPYSRGMGAIGLPGDLSSTSRFVRAAFVKNNSISKDDEASAISQFFHILGSVAQPRGSVRLTSGEFEITRYSSCCNTDRGIYYYTTYGNCCITAVDLNEYDIDSASLFYFPLETKLHINYHKSCHTKMSYFNL